MTITTTFLHNSYLINIIYKEIVNEIDLLRLIVDILIQFECLCDVNESDHCYECLLKRHIFNMGFHVIDV